MTCFFHKLEYETLLTVERFDRKEEMIKRGGENSRSKLFDPKL